MQKNAIRLISHAKYNAHTEPLFKLHQILPLPDLKNFFRLQTMHRYTWNLTPVPLQGMWQRTSDREIGVNNIQLRNNNRLIIPFLRLALTERLPKSSLPRQWESFPNDTIKNTISTLEFDSKLKKFFLDDLSEVVNCNRLFCPVCSRPGN